MKHSFTGLSDAEVQESRKKFGSNELSPYKVESFWDKLAENFKDPIIIILNVALAIILVLSFFDLSEWYEAIAIAIAVALATLVSTFSEFKNESSFQKLQEEASRIQNNTFRNGQPVKIPINEVVVGDYVLLQAGDKIPADGIIVDGDLRVNQASLTGESEGVTKVSLPEGDTIEKDVSDKYSLFRGSVVDDGEAIMLVENVGDKTFYGGLARELSISDGRLSPLQVKLKNLARLISKFGYIAGVTIAVTTIFINTFVENDFDLALVGDYVTNLELFLPDILDALILSIIIVVAAVPEGLPMMIAIVLSLNMRKLLKENVLVRKLLGIETVGSLNILFSDKTGTITRGKLVSNTLVTPTGKIYKKYSDIPDSLRELVSISVLENTAAYLSPDGHIIGGNVSERALIEFVDADDIKKIDSLGVEEENRILFNSVRKFSATQVKNVVDLIGVDLNSVTLIKGAPEVVLSSCTSYYNEDGSNDTLTEEDKGRLTKQLDDLADAGIRLIALAVSEDPIDKEENLPKNSRLIGVIGISDEIRNESQFAINDVQGAGIQVVMITGDKKGTAISIAKQVDLLEDENDIVIGSGELNKVSDEDVKEMLPNVKVIARALPTDKSRLVNISKSLGKVVGMTGDGVNDSAALKQADVGIAMGSGSEVSKEAGDIVILDDNFISISNAVRYGRTIFKSIRKFIIFQLTINVAAVTTVFFGPHVGINFPLTIIQLLWINIIMDTLGAISYGGEPALRRYMKEKPIDRNANILTNYMKSSILINGIFIMVYSLFFVSFDPVAELFIRNGEPSEAVLMTAFFNLFMFMIVFNSFNVRTEKMNLIENILQNKIFLSVMLLIFTLQIIFTYIGGPILRVVPLNIQEWSLVFILASVIIPVDLFRKFLWGLINDDAARI